MLFWGEGFDFIPNGGQEAGPGVYHQHSQMYLLSRFCYRPCESRCSGQYFFLSSS